MLRVTDTIELDPAELEEVFLRASGPGGQNVNKDARARLVALIREAAVPPKRRRPTRPPRASKARRVDDKARRGRVKALRRSGGDED